MTTVGGKSTGRFQLENKLKMRINFFYLYSVWQYKDV